MATYGFDEKKNIVEINTTGGESHYMSELMYFSSLSRTTSTFNNGTLIKYEIGVSSDSLTSTTDNTSLISDLENNKTYLISISEFLDMSTNIPLGKVLIGPSTIALGGIYSLVYTPIIANISIYKTSGSIYVLSFLTNINISFLSSFTLSIYQT